MECQIYQHEISHNALDQETDFMTKDLKKPVHDHRIHNFFLIAQIWQNLQCWSSLLKVQLMGPLEDDTLWIKCHPPCCSKCSKLWLIQSVIIILLVRRSISSGTERWKWNWLYPLIEHYIARLDILNPQVVWEWTLPQRYKIWGLLNLQLCLLLGHSGLGVVDPDCHVGWGLPLQWSRGIHWNILLLCLAIKLNEHLQQSYPSKDKKTKYIDLSVMKVWNTPPDQQLRSEGNVE